jgi:hypothetical protein
MDRSALAVKEIHLIPEHHEDDWHTTKDCWCRPAVLDVRVSLVQTERIVFHAEVSSRKEDPE